MSPVMPEISNRNTRTSKKCFCWILIRSIRNSVKRKKFFSVQEKHVLSLTKFVCTYSTIYWLWFLILQSLGLWVPTPGVSGSNPLGWLPDWLSLSSFRFRSNEYQDLFGTYGKSQLSLLNVTVALRQLNPIHKKGSWRFKVKYYYVYMAVYWFVKS